MVLCPLEGVERTVLKLGWSIGGHTNLADIHAAICTDLETIAVNEGRGPIPRHQDVSMVHVSDNVSSFVKGCESASYVSGYVDKEKPVRRGEFSEPSLW